MDSAPNRRHRLSQALRDWLASPRLPWRVAAIAVLLSLPALGLGWQLDDHFQRLIMLEMNDTEAAPMEAFSSLRDPELNRLYIDLGYLPWWTPEGFRLAFFRPLSVATMRLDYWLWPDSAALMHAHSLLWLAALVAAAAGLYRRLQEPIWVAGLAGLLYALDDAHAGPAAWLANRNALVATCFGVLCLMAHDRWRRGGWQPGAWVAPALLGLALLSGEAGLGATGYLFAYALFVEPGRGRWRSLGPHAGVVAVWSAIYWIGGYGVRGSGLYIDPLQSPLAYLRALLERAPFLLLGQWTPAPAELSGLVGPAALRLWWLAAVGVAALLLAVLLPLLRQDRVARFWGLGMLISLLPIAATFPSNRLLFFVGLGAMGLAARFLETTLAKPGEQGSAWRLRRGVAWGLVVTHLVLSPLGMPLAASWIRQLGEPMLVAAASLGNDPRLGEQDLVLVSSPDYLMFVSNLPTLQALAGRPFPRRMRALAVGPTEVELSRLDERTLRVDLERGLFSGLLARLFRDADHRLRPGDRVSLDGLEVEVLEPAPDDTAGAVLYRFKVPLEDPSLRWVRWQAGRYVAFEPPAIGETVALPPAIGPWDSFARWE